MKKMTALFLLAIFTATISACSTMEGLGKDVQKVGEKIEDKASRKR